MKKVQLLAKIGGGSLIALFSVAAVPEAKAAHIVDVTGTPGAGFTRWTFSGSDTATESSFFRNFPSANSSTNADTTEITSPNSGNFIADAGISDQSFAVVSGAAIITAGSNSEALGGIFLNDDGTGDDLGFRAVGSDFPYSLGDTISISGTGLSRHCGTKSIIDYILKMVGYG
ncbi:MAG: hypothetical protein QNJ66_22300, partial [Crocosphaera sp.]|nr:hypothetical protein [Crocosphaera sp.]